jgi:hypothetical protein
MARYIVTIADKHPAPGEQPNRIEFEAQSEREAIASARNIEVWRSRYDSPVRYSAELVQ